VGHSALWIAPTSVSAEAGALIKRLLWWWRHLHLRLATAQRLDHVEPFVFGRNNPAHACYLNTNLAICKIKNVISTNTCANRLGLLSSNQN
jgi:hypothetical protein